MTQLICTLPKQELDIIGDIHGEFGSLCSLLDRLGYDDQGRHINNRRLVFVGDLIDRGPNSIEVLELIIPMIESGRASAVAGNHELNLLRKKKKHGNKWFYGESEHLFTPQDTNDDQLLTHKTFTRRLGSDTVRERYLQFFQSLPVALERDDIRIVHACWDKQSIEKLRTGNQNIIERYFELEEELSTLAAPESFFSKQSPPTAETIAKKQVRDLFLQNNNPIKVTTSGLEQKAEKVMFIGGEARYTSRKRWWKEYNGPPVVFGHYWRRRSAKHIPSNNPLDIRKSPPPYVFSDFGSFDWLNKCFCVDYSVGARYAERAAKKMVGSTGAYLCAFRTLNSKYSLHFDDGLSVEL